MMNVNLNVSHLVSSFSDSIRSQVLNKQIVMLLIKDRKNNSNSKNWTFF